MKTQEPTRNIKRHLVFLLTNLLVLMVQSIVLAQEGKLVNDTIHSPALEGNLLGDSADRRVIVYLPPSYETSLEQRYPVVYLLHGYTGRPTRWTGGYQGFNIKTTMDAFVAEGISYAQFYRTVL